MSDMYMPLAEAKESTSNLCMPGKYPVKFVTSAKEVDETNELGIRFKVIARVEGTNASCFEDFRGPRTPEEKESLSQMISKRTGKVYKDMGFAKMEALQAATGKTDITSVDQALDMFDAAHVNWQVNLEVNANEKDIDDWGGFQEWLAENRVKGKPGEYEGQRTVKVTFYQVKDDNEKVIKELLAYPGVKAKNTLQSFNPKVSLVQ